jgi:hypothetical protein
LRFTKGSRSSNKVNVGSTRRNNSQIVHIERATHNTSAAQINGAAVNARVLTG